MFEEKELILIDCEEIHQKISEVLDVCKKEHKPLIRLLNFKLASCEHYKLTRDDV